MARSACRCNPCRSIAARLWRESVVAGIGISTPRLCKARAIMEIELSSWRAFARSTSLTREERVLPPLVTMGMAVQDRMRRNGRGS